MQVSSGLCYHYSPTESSCSLSPELLSTPPTDISRERFMIEKMGSDDINDGLCYPTSTGSIQFANIVGGGCG
jgi:hypothetical protein